MERDVCGRCSETEALGLSAHSSILAKSITYTLYSVGPLTHPPSKASFRIHYLGWLMIANVYISAFLGSSSHSFLFSFLKNNFYRYLCMCVCTCVWYLFRLEEGVGSSGARITGSCQPHPGYRALILGLLRDHYMLLSTEPLLHSVFFLFFRDRVSS